MGSIKDKVTRELALKQLLTLYITCYTWYYMYYNITIAKLLILHTLKMRHVRKYRNATRRGHVTSVTNRITK